MYLFGNEGNNAVDVEVSLKTADNGGEQEGSASEAKTEEPLLSVDLWRGSCLQLQGTKKRFRLHLEPSETLLVIPGATAKGMGALAVTSDSAKDCRECPDWTSRFEPADRKDNAAEYVYRFEAGTVTGQECFSVRGDEMIECFCNGSFVDVSFFGETETDRVNVKHRFCVGPYLRQGENEIRLKCTGSAANIYENADIPYGLSEGFVS